MLASYEVRQQRVQMSDAWDPGIAYFAWLFIEEALYENIEAYVKEKQISKHLCMRLEFTVLRCTRWIPVKIISTGSRTIPCKWFFPCSAKCRQLSRRLNRVRVVSWDRQTASCRFQLFFSQKVKNILKKQYCVSRERPLKVWWSCQCCLALTVGV